MSTERRSSRLRTAVSLPFEVVLPTPVAEYLRASRGSEVRAAPYTLTAASGLEVVSAGTALLSDPRVAAGLYAGAKLFELVDVGAQKARAVIQRRVERRGSTSA